MDIKLKYHYTYFLNPFVVDDLKYEQFLSNLIKNPKWKYRLFDKASDMEIFTHFLAQTKKFMFESFYWTEEYKNKIKDLDHVKLAKEFANVPCTEFVYDLNDELQMHGKIESENQIYFEISEIRLICFKNGVCFMVFKTHIVDDDYISFRELLNFNYKFKDIASSYAEFKNKDIHIQTSAFDTMESVKDFIDETIKGYVELYNEDIYSDRMFVYSYACVDEGAWNQDTDFRLLENDLYKYVFQFSGDYDSDIVLSEEEKREFIYSKWKYSKYGFTKLGGVVFTSAVDHFNFTKLPEHYEKVSFYIMLFAFYKRISLLVLNNELQNASISDFSVIRDIVNDEMGDSRFSQISNSSHGMSLWKNWFKAFELKELYDEIDKKYNRMCGQVNATNAKRFYLFASLLLILIYIITAFGRL